MDLLDLAIVVSSSVLIAFLTWSTWNIRRGQKLRADSIERFRSLGIVLLTELKKKFDLDFVHIEEEYDEGDYWWDGSIRDIFLITHWVYSLIVSLEYKDDVPGAVLTIERTIDGSKRQSIVYDEAGVIKAIEENKIFIQRFAHVFLPTFD